MFDPLSFLLFFAFGLTVGSFLNCLVYRLEIGQLNNRGFWLGRSYCPHCRHELSWLDLIPVISFLMLAGKCRYCKKKISLQYPLVELATGILFLLILNFSAQGEQFLNLFFGLLISSFLIVIFVYDLKHYIIPDRIVYPAIAASLIFQSLFSWLYGSMALWLYGFFAAFGAAAFFLAIVLITRGKGMGIGDVKLAFLMGLILGWPNILLALFSAFFIGAIIGVGLIMSGRKKMTSQVPFGPFLVTGTFLAMFLGKEITEWYLSFFF